MRNIIGCRIKTVKTGLFCEIAIGWDNGSIPYAWSKIENKMARLNIAKNGRWGYLTGNEHYGGVSITILPQSPHKKTPGGGEVFTAIVDLLALPEDFMEKAKCGNYSSGHGIWRATGEGVEYELFLPCA